MNLPSVAFEHPLWLLLAPACIVAFLLLRYLRRARGTSFAEPALLEWLRAAPGARRRLNLALAVALLLVAAASGPWLDGAREEQRRPALDLALVLDLSPSMQAGDVAPDRLQRARMELHDLLARRAGPGSRGGSGSGDRAALIAFSAHAYRVLPLTGDLALVDGYIDALDTTLTRQRGSNLVQALELAARTLEAAPADGRAIVLVSDGEADDPAAVAAAAQRLARRGMPVFALGIGGTAGAPVPTPTGLARGASGDLHLSRLDGALLAGLAAGSGGRYAEARAGDADWNDLEAGLAALHPAGHEATPANGYPLHPWLLAAALVLLLWQGRRYHGALPALALLVALPSAKPAFATSPLAEQAQAAAPMPAPASTPGSALAAKIATMHFAPAAAQAEREAHRELAAGRYPRAAALYEALGGYRGSMGAGAAAYRQSDWTRALALFREAAQAAGNDEERALAWYDEATTLARMRRLDEALARFDQVLEIRPGHARAALNRDLLQRALERRNSMASDAIAAKTRADANDVSGGGEFQHADAPSDEAGADSIAAGTRPATANAAGASALAMAGAEGEGAPAAALSSAGASARIPAGAVPDDPRVVLRHRFMLMDAEHAPLPETSPW